MYVVWFVDVDHAVGRLSLAASPTDDLEDVVCWRSDLRKSTVACVQVERDECSARRRKVQCLTDINISSRA